MSDTGGIRTKASADPTKLRKDTRDWLASHTIRDAQSIATDLENAGEDVTDLLHAIDDLEALVRGGGTAPRRPSKR